MNHLFSMFSSHSHYEPLNWRFPSSLYLGRQFHFHTLPFILTHPFIRFHENFPTLPIILTPPFILDIRVTTLRNRFPRWKRLMRNWPINRHLTKKRTRKYPRDCVSWPSPGHLKWTSSENSTKSSRKFSKNSKIVLYKYYISIR